jgi:hypothetical protein
MMDTDSGRVGVADQALVASDQAASRLAPTGFDPSRFKPQSYEGKPRNLSKPHRNVLNQFVEFIDCRIDEMTPLERRILLDACLSVSPINCAWDTFKIAGIVIWHLQETAIAMEARQGRDAEERLDTKDDSAGRNGIARKG